MPPKPNGFGGILISSITVIIRSYNKCNIAEQEPCAEKFFAVQKGLLGTILRQAPSFVAHDATSAGRQDAEFRSSSHCSEANFA